MPSKIVLLGDLEKELKDIGRKDLYRDTYSCGVLAGSANVDKNYANMDTKWDIYLGKNKIPVNSILSAFNMEENEKYENLKNIEKNIEEYRLKIEDGNTPYFIQYFTNTDIWRVGFLANRVYDIDLEIDMLYSPENQKFEIFDRGLNKLEMDIIPINNLSQKTPSQ